MTDPVREFERVFAEYVGARYCIALCNGTATLHTALVALGVKPGDRVAVPPLTMSSTTIGGSGLCGWLDGQGAARGPTDSPRRFCGEIAMGLLTWWRYRHLEEQERAADVALMRADMGAARQLGVDVAKRDEEERIRAAEMDYSRWFATRMS